METILWFAGILAVWTGLRFVHLVFKRLGSKDNMNDLIDRMEDGMQDAANNVANGIKNRKQRRKEQKEQPVVIIH